MGVRERPTPVSIFRAAGGTDKDFDLTNEILTTCGYILLTLVNRLGKLNNIIDIMNTII